MKILSIGNSFSQDAQHYLYLLARGAGIKIKSVNLYIGGCSLYRHYRNMLSGERAYGLEMNGEPTGFTMSINEALLSDEWDVVTLQQASHFSPKPDTYAPFVAELVAHIRKYAPKAKILFYKTWAYEANSDRLNVMMGYQTSEEMAADIDNAVKREALPYVDGVIPAGDAMLTAMKRGIKIHRDTFHASLGIGRLLLAATWLATLTGRDVPIDAVPTLDIEGEATPVSEIVAIANETAKASPLGFAF